MRKSIRARLTVAFIGLAIGPLLLVGSIIAWQTFIAQQQQALDMQREVTQRVAAQVTAFFEEVENDLYYVSQIQGLQTLDQQDEQRRVLSGLLAHQGAFQELVLLDSKGHEQVYLSRLTVTPTDLGSRAESDEFIIPSTSAEVYYSPVWFDENTGEPLMTTALPLLDLRTGLVDGVLVAETRIKRIWDLISSVRLSQGQSIYIVDTEGKVVAHRNPSVVLRGTHFDVPDRDGIQTGLTGSRVVLTAQVVHFGQQEFYIVAEQAISEALALAINTVVIIAILILAALVVSSTLGVLTMRQIVLPIKKMAETAQAISVGDLSQQVKVTSRDELGILADTFNSMTVQLQTLIDSLEQQVAERTAQLEASNKELEAFSYSVSHDLRAPLRHIAGFIRLLRQREGERWDATSLHYLDTITESTNRMDLLIDDLLAFSRAGRIEMRVQQIELDKMVREVQQELVADIENRPITWKIAPLPSVQGDPVLLRQVWTNLLSNAIKFTAPQPEARVEIGTLPSDAKSSYVTLFVRDNGVGFDPQYSHKLFGVFQRLHREEDFKGTGIGLAAVRRIIERHGGQVWAESELGHGATFYLTLKKAGEK